MLSDANRNRLLILLLLQNKLPMEEVVDNIGPKGDINEYIRELNYIYKADINIEINRDTNEILLDVFNEDSLYSNLSCSNMHDFNDFRCRIAFLLNVLINKETYLNILDFCDYMNVSRSTVNNDIRKAKKLLKKYNAEIVGVPNKGIKFKSNEFSKRLILIYEVFDYFPSGICLDNRLISLIKTLAENYRMNDSIKLLMYKVTILSIYRIKKNEPLNITVPMYKNFEIDSKELNDFIKKIQEIYEIELSREETDFISFPINTRNPAYSGTIDNAENEESLREIVSQMLENVREKFMIHIDEEDFFKNVRHHLLFLINRLAFKIPVKDIFSDQIRIRFPLAFELARASMNVLHEEYNLVGTTVDISYLAVYFALILDESKMVHDDSSNIRKVAVVTNRGRGTFELIRRQLQGVIGPNSKIDLLTVSDLIREDTSQYGILFSTENIVTDVYTPIIQISGIIDQGTLSKELSEIENKKLDSMENLCGTTELKVMHLDGNNGYRNNVRVITDHLIQEENVSKDVFNIFDKKENLSSMIYENGIAFPHLTDKIINKLSLTLGILKPETDGVKIIFFLLIPENMDDRQEKSLIEIYDQIFTIISEKDSVSKLQGFSSVNDLCNFFNERKLLI